MTQEIQRTSSKRRWVWVGLSVATVAAAALATAAVTAPRLEAHGMRWGHGQMDPELAKERVEFVSNWVLDQVDGTDEQKDFISTRLQQAVDELMPLGVEHRSHKESMHLILAETTIDRDRLEEIRRAELELADLASRIVVETVADVAEALSLEQRAELAEFAERHHH